MSPLSTASRGREILTYCILSIICLSIYYFGCVKFAWFLRLDDKYWYAIGFMLVLNYLMLDLLYGWPLTGRFTGRAHNQGVAILRGNKTSRKRRNQSEVKNEDNSVRPSIIENDGPTL